jgi:RNA polymerase sigma-70 factor, ECF subfamily
MRRDLVERAMAGDLEAFGELTRLEIDKLYVIARLIVRDTERARDATPDALIAAWRDIAALRDPDRFDTWVRRLVVHACYHQLRGERRRWHHEGRVGPFSESEPDPAVASANRDELDRAFARLEPEQRALIVLHFYVGLPVQETAVVLGLPVGTVKSRLSRTLAQMRAQLDADARVPIVEGRLA